MSCEAGPDRDDAPYCGRDAVASCTFACIHEHVGKADLCKAHSVISRWFGWDCLRCKNGPDPHICPVEMTWTDL